MIVIFNNLNIDTTIVYYFNGPTADENVINFLVITD